ncbi:hypothetical protein BKA70DRAFT_53560 [Coprinopsis sp. MPI-PUGE-AT-0042]|nr:hypothetical protein BKA70DRAFT_53560 [Coprinopsis sp. MPI-PUGE-AT-0042]
MDVFCTIPGNPDIAGIGVRIAIYAQNILSFFPALWALWDGIVTQEELISAEIQSTTNLVLAFAILISSIVQAQTLGLDTYHGNIVLNISWMNNTNVFIYFLLYVRYKSQPGKGHVELRWSAWVTHVKHQLASLFVSVNPGADQRLGASDPDLETSPRETQVAAPEPSAKLLGKSLVKRIVLFVGSFHLTVMSGLGIWLWSRPHSFGVETNDANKCAVEHALVSILGTRIPLGSNALRIFSLVLYSLFLVPGFNLLLPSAAFLGLHIWCSKPKSPTRSSTFPLPTNRIKLAFRPLLQLTQKRRDVLPAFIGLAILLVINLIFVIDIELTLVRNKGLQLEGETQWGFGQILAMLLVLLPLRDIAEAVLARRMKNRKKEIVEDLEMAAKRRDFAAFCRALERGAKTRRAVFEGLPALAAEDSSKRWTFVAHEEPHL